MEVFRKELEDLEGHFQYYASHSLKEGVHDHQLELEMLGWPESAGHKEQPGLWTATSSRSKFSLKLLLSPAKHSPTWYKAKYDGPKVRISEFKSQLCQSIINCMLLSKLLRLSGII